jgi:hypothetical protein
MVNEAFPPFVKYGFKTLHGLHTNATAALGSARPQ